MVGDEVIDARDEKDLSVPGRVVMIVLPWCCDRIALLLLCLMFRYFSGQTTIYIAYTPCPPFSDKTSLRLLQVIG